jgi:16S rRNA (cytosine1402-N4)-methyltransferase
MHESAPWPEVAENQTQERPILSFPLPSSALALRGIGGSTSARLGGPPTPFATGRPAEGRPAEGRPAEGRSAEGRPIPTTFGAEPARSRSFDHVPVMAAEVVDLLASVPDGLVVDATVGGGGHAAAILAAYPRLSLLGLDRDREAVAAAQDRLARFGSRAEIVQATFDQLVSVVESRQPLRGVSAVLFDLGVSSPQLDRADRGFSYREDGPLDMRMDQSQGPTAAEFLRDCSEERLVAILVENGEARFARRIARSLLAARPLRTTEELAEVVRSAIPAVARQHRGHPAKRVFQALRIEVNAELELLGAGLDAALGLIVPGGRCVVLSYHSGEDRLVKSRFVEAATGGCVCPPRLPCVCGATPTVRLLNRGARLASEEELEANPRSASARLRSVEILGRLRPGERPGSTAS